MSDLEMQVEQAVKQHTPVSPLKRQTRYVDSVKQLAGEMGLVIPEAFVRGIRHLGYKSNIEALAELVDNSVQAYAERIDLVLGYANGGSSAKPEQLAVVDDGHGMSPEMLRFAIMWGGTHRENDRAGLGRFGYGLPCAIVSMGRRFTIYSKLRRGRIFAVSLDLDLLDNGGYRNKACEITIPAAAPAELPAFVIEAIRRSHPNGWHTGTVVVVDKLDRLDWTTATGLRRNLLRHFGVMYHKLLTSTELYVDCEQVRPIDPLFLEPECALHAIDEDRAHALDPLTFTVSCGDGSAGDITLRYAWLPPTFAATDKSRDAIGINANARFPIMKSYHGLVFSRNGRVVDVHSRTPWTTFINNDRYIRVEVEFSATLDEAFGVTTSKQQVSLSPEMWDHLRVSGLPKAIEHLRAKVRGAKAERQRSVSRTAVVSCDREEQGVTAAAAQESKVPLVLAQSVTRKRLIELVQAALQASDSPSLSALLKLIGHRGSSGNPAMIAEYRHLLIDWCREISRTS